MNKGSLQMRYTEKWNSTCLGRASTDWHAHKTDKLRHTQKSLLQKTKFDYLVHKSLEWSLQTALLLEFLYVHFDALFSRLVSCYYYNPSFQPYHLKTLLLTYITTSLIQSN